MPKALVLVLCTGNSCRSQMGEGWVRHLLGDRVEVRSAGTRPSFVHPRAIQVMGEAGVDLSSHTSKGVESLKGISFDLVVTVCDSAREACPVFPGAKKTIHHAFEDPASGEGDDALPVFRRVRDEIRVALVPLVTRELGLAQDSIGQ
ncbi:MAG: arsenate reductase ArsC [Holophagales bacterium]|nr:arsenate reductase ArsC [Holophagales bacterium]